MKKLIIIGAILAILIAGGVVAMLYFNSIQKVTINLKQPNIKAGIYKVGEDTHEGEDDEKIQTVENSETLTLQKGDYYLRAEGREVADTRISFTLANEPVTVEVDPKLSKDALKEKLKAEKTAIDAALLSRYPQLIPQYTVTEGVLLEKGEWYGTLLKLKADNGQDEADVYRVVMHKVDNSWQVVGKPDLVLTAANYSDVPIEALREINRLNQ